MCYRIPDDNSYRKPDLTTERQGFCRKAHRRRWALILMCPNSGDSSTRTCCPSDCACSVWPGLLVSQRLETTLGTVAQGGCARHPGGSLSSLTVLFSAPSINQSMDYEHDIWQKEHSSPAGSMLLEACRDKVSICLTSQVAGHTQHIPGCSGVGSGSRTHPTLPCCRPSPG